MRCDVCGSTDHVLFIQPDGSDGELHLCRTCAAERGYLGEPTGQPVTSCPVCGMTIDRLRSGGKLGCPGCARTFKPEILAMQRRSGSAGRYEGKIPRSLPRRPAGSDIERLAFDAGPEAGKAVELEAELEAAIQSENFEHAASLRDRISAMRNQIQ